MKFPIILNENGDLSFYNSLQMAEKAVEVVDVKNGEYEGFDATGRRLQFMIVDSSHVKICLAGDGATYVGRLEALLRDFLSRVDGRPTDLPLDKLLDCCQRFVT